MWKRPLLLALLIVGILLESIIVMAPPTPHNVAGTVFTINTANAAVGTKVRINNTIENTTSRTLTSGPPFNTGAYSLAIDGNDNDNVTGTAWNITHFGINESNLLAATTSLHIILSNLRPSEVNLTLNMTNDTFIVNITETFNFTANISIEGGQNAIDCSATINLSSIHVYLTPGETLTHSLGNINLREYYVTSWNLTANISGYTNISVNASCASDGLNFDEVNRKITYNITITDPYRPTVRLITPLNGTSTANTFQSLYYNVTDDSIIENCTLFVDEFYNQTMVPQGKGLWNFTVNFSIAYHNFSVNCTDNSTSHNEGSSEQFFINITPSYAPVFGQIYLQSPIDLSPGGIKEITCNATVSDTSTETVTVNATIYDQAYNFGSPDDNNSHYTNSSCKEQSVSGDERNFTCKFRLMYFANNNTWYCNLSANDTGGYVSTSSAPFLINELVAIDTAATTIEYGNLTVTQTSQVKGLNVTNVGNKPINISVFGFGGDDELLYVNNALWCPRGLVYIGYERFSITSLPYNMMHNLTSSQQQANLTIQKLTNQSNLSMAISTTYWAISLPPGIGGWCNGTIVFVANLA